MEDLKPHGTPWLADALFGEIGYPAENLPDGWTVVESPKTFVKGIAPDGRAYFLSMTHAYPCRIAKKGNRFMAEGTEFIDSKTGVIELSPEKQ